jgi:hypothetical protein
MRKQAAAAGTDVVDWMAIREAQRQLAVAVGGEEQWPAVLGQRLEAARARWIEQQKADGEEARARWMASGEEAARWHWRHAHGGWTQGDGGLKHTHSGWSQDLAQ